MHSSTSRRRCRARAPTARHRAAAASRPRPTCRTTNTRADDLAVALGDPAALPLRVEVLDEARAAISATSASNVSSQPYSSRIEPPWRRDDPADVAGPVRAQDARWHCGARPRRRADVSTACIACRRAARPLRSTRRQHRCDLVCGGLVRAARTPAGPRRQRSRRLPSHPPASALRSIRPRVETAQDAAEIAGVEPEIARRDRWQSAGRDAPARRGRALRSSENGLSRSPREHADVPRVEAVEAADLLDLVVRRQLRHVRHRRLPGGPESGILLTASTIYQSWADIWNAVAFGEVPDLVGHLPWDLV